MFYKDLNNFKDKNGYEIEGKWYPRVTSILQIKAKPALYYFYGALSSYREGEVIKTRSAQEGTLIHNVVEAILENKDVVVPETIQPLIAAFYDFRKHFDISPLHIELPVVSKEHGYAGTLDVIANIDGQVGVLDIKTSQAIYRDFNIQTAAYVEALKENKSIPRPLTRWILRLDQLRTCMLCKATLRVKGGRTKVRNKNGLCAHSWGPIEGEVELKELHGFDQDIKAFLAAKALWEWEHEEWIKQL